MKIRSVSPAITTIRLARRARAKCALDSGGIGRRNVHYGAEWRVSTTWAIYVWFKSKPIQEVEFKPVAFGVLTVIVGYGRTATIGGVAAGCKPVPSW